MNLAPRGPYIISPVIPLNTEGSLVKSENDRVINEFRIGEAQDNQEYIRALAESKVPDPRWQSWGSRLVRRVMRRPFADTDSRSSLQNWLNINQFTTMPGSEEGYFEKREEELTAARGKLEAEVTVGVAQLRDQLKRYAVSVKAALNEYWDSGELPVPQLIKDAKAANEQQTGKNIEWIDWFSAHASDEQLINVAQWCSHYVEQKSNEPEFKARIQRFRGDYSAALAKAYEDGLIDNWTVSYATQNLQYMPIRAVSPLSVVAPSKSLGGLAHRDQGYIEVGPNATDFTLYHEASHMFFGFHRVSMVFEEGGADTFATYMYERVHGEGSAKEYQVYHKDLEIIDIFCTVAGVSKEEFLQIYSGRQPLNNIVELAHRTEERLGIDMLLFLEKYCHSNTSKYVEEFGHDAAIGARYCTFDIIEVLGEVFGGLPADHTCLTRRNALNLIMEKLATHGKDGPVLEERQRFAYLSLIGAYVML